MGIERRRKVGVEKKVEGRRTKGEEGGGRGRKGEEGGRSDRSGGCLHLIPGLCRSCGHVNSTAARLVPCNNLDARYDRGSTFV